MPSQLSKLRVRTRAIAADGNLIERLAENPLTFIRDGEGIIGSGVAARLSAIGEDRFHSLSTQWNELAAAAEVNDSVGGSGRGLIAFGAIAFSDSSQTESVLIVPRKILGIKDDRAWITQIWLADETEPAEISSIDDFEPSHENYQSEIVELREGQISAQDFERNAANAIASIAQGELEKVVLARDLVGELPAGFDVRESLRKLATKFENCWTYSVDGTFGASPELLVRVSHSQVSARVLAGTASRGTDPDVDRAIAQALSNSTKNRHEHAFAVSSLVQALQPYCSQVLADENPFSLSLPNLWHLASDVTAVLTEDNSSLDISSALHPTAAVAGTPTNSAIEFLEKLEKVDRGRYTGPVGWIDAKGDGEWAIALRGAQITSNRVQAFAGCGLVSESEPAAELAETELKFQPIRFALN